jgi:hypothetical protein
MDTLHEARRNINALRSILGDGRAFAVIGSCASFAHGHRDAYELALASELFRCWAIREGENEAKAARWASLRSEPHWIHGGQPGREGQE